MTKITKLLNKVDENLETSIERLISFLRIQSISTDPKYKDECTKAAKFLVDELKNIGFEAQIYKTAGHPMVVAQYGDNQNNKPHLLFYGHYDVQPVDPIELWDTSPFEPDVIEVNGAKRIRGRGASDDKGQLMTFVEACRVFIEENGEIPCRLTLLFEGEEECGSPSLQPFLDEHGEVIRADIALVCDTNMWDSQTPAIATSLRGMANEEITIIAADRDLHSGYYGGAAQNPIRILTNILAKIHDENGRVTLEGFYDDVPETDPNNKKQWDKLNMSDEKFLSEVGLKKSFGEKQYTVLEKLWARPTAEINGIQGGYTGEGIKTVIPSCAFAKVSFRLVGTQNPQQIIQSLHKHVEQYLPSDCSVEYASHSQSTALYIDPNLPELKKAADVLTEEWGKQTAIIGMGGSIPIATSFKKQLGMDCLFIGFGLADDNIHSPNEKYEITSFHKGIKSWIRILNALAA